MIAHPQLPLILIGSISGQVYFLDCRLIKKPRIVSVKKTHDVAVIQIKIIPQMNLILTVGSNDRICLLSSEVEKNFCELATTNMISRISTLFVSERNCLCIAVILQIPSESSYINSPICTYVIQESLLKNPEQYHSKPTSCIFDDRNISMIAWKIPGMFSDILMMPSSDASDELKVNFYFLSTYPSATNKTFKNLKLSLLELKLNETAKFVTDTTNSALSFFEPGEVLDLNDFIGSEGVHLKRVDGTINKTFIYNSCGVVGLVDLTKGNFSYIELDRLHYTHSKKDMHITWYPEHRLLASCAWDSSITLSTLTEISSEEINDQSYQLSLEDCKLLEKMTEVKMMQEDIEDLSSNDILLKSPSNEAFTMRITNSFETSFMRTKEIEEDKIYASERKQIRKELQDLRNIVNEMYKSNTSMQDYEKLNAMEFDLDFEEQSNVMTETNELIDKARSEIKRQDLGTKYMWKQLLKQVWDEIDVKGRSLCGFDTAFEVPNYPLKEFIKEEESEIEKIRIRRQIDREIRSELSIQAIDKKQEEENTSNSLNGEFLNGGNVQKLVQMETYLYDQLDLNNRERQIEQIVLTKDLKAKFNYLWQDMYNRKDQDLSRIREKQLKVQSIVDDLIFFVKDPVKVKIMVFGTVECEHHLKLVDFNSKEQPERLLQVDESEIKVEKYYTKDQLLNIEKQRKEDEERVRLAALDNWRERGLEEMMGGVLQVRREDELKKEISKPIFIIMNKPEDRWEDEERLEYKEYLQRCKAWEEERDKHKKQLELDVKRILQTIEDIKGKFNELFIDLFNQWIVYHSAVLQEEYKIEKVKRNLVDLELIKFKEYLIEDRIIKAKERFSKTIELHREARNLVDAVQEDYDILIAEDRLMEKQFKKEFSECPAHLLEFLWKQFKRRPKKTFGVRGIVPKNSNIKSYKTDSDNPDQISETSLNEDSGLAIMENPYIDVSISNFLSANIRDHQLDLTFQELETDHNYKHEYPNLDARTWMKFCEYRRKKISIENDIKKMSQQLADMQTFVSDQADEGRGINSIISNLENDLQATKDTEIRLHQDFEVHLLLKQGFVEIDPYSNSNYIPDCSGAVCVKREEIEILNHKIISLGDEKLDHLAKKKELNKKFNTLEWNLKEMLMLYQDLQTKIHDIHHFKITGEILNYLRTNDYDGFINAKIVSTEQAFQLLRQVHQKKMDDRSKRLKKFEVHIRKKYDLENTKKSEEIHNLNLEVNQAAQAYCRSTGGIDIKFQYEKRYKNIVKRQALLDKAKSQSSDIKVLRKEIERLRLRTFPALVHHLDRGFQQF